MHATLQTTAPFGSRPAPAAAPALGPPTRRLRVCIVSHFAYGAISGGATGRLVGGVEWQTSLTARWLAARGHDVSLLTWNEGPAGDELIDGVRVLKMCSASAGVPILRFFHPRWTSLVDALRRADAEVYYHNCGEYVTGQVAMWCRKNRRAFVYSAASDPDCDARLPQMRTLRERVLYRRGLRLADRRIVQTNHQRQMLRAGFALDSQVIPMPCVAPPIGDGETRALSPAGSARVLWVARIVPLKRLEWLLDIAERLPDVHFDVIGPPDPQTPYTDALLLRGAGLPNVTMHGRVDRGAMSAYYRAASLLCCTSTFEGFPNTFLEAFSHGVPVVTTVDPDNLIKTRRLGGAAADVDGLVSEIRRLLGSPDACRAASSAAHRYFYENHAVDVVLPRFEQVFSEVVCARG